MHEYSAFLNARPNDAEAQAGLGTVLYRQRNFAAALGCFRKAAELAPSNGDIQTNYGTLLAIAGQLAEAQKAFERALADDPSSEAARANLERVKAQLASGARH